MEWSGVELGAVQWSGVEWSVVEWSGVDWYGGVEWNRMGLAWRTQDTLAWLGLAWLGLAWPGLAWLGLAWLGLAWLGLAQMERQSKGHSKGGSDD